MFNLRSLLSKTSADQPSRDAWYFKAIEECADGHWDWNLSKGEVYLSSQLRELIGYSKEETQQLSIFWWLERIHSQDRAEMHRKIEELACSKSQHAYFDAFRFLCKNGDYVWFESHARILRGTDGKIIRMVGIITNITPQKYIHNQLYAIIADQETNDQNKLRFLSTLSHEFRSPLSGILGMASLLKETNLTQDQLHFTDNISNSTEMLLALVNDILDVTKINSGKFGFEKIRFSPLRVIKSAADLIRPNIIKKNLTFNILLSDEIPEFLMGDPTRLQQILINLLTNAVKFTSKGGIDFLVTNNSHPSSEEATTRTTLYFEIRDTGIGIPPETQSKLFEDFIQANTSISRIYGGTGLGLSICKELVHLMGGEIGVKSELDRGSTFWFTIPFERQEADDFLPETSPAFVSRQPSQQSLMVLLVEDNQVNQDVMRGLLKVLGDEVTVANNGQEAVDLFPSQKFDIVLMDLNMPILDGLTATEAIRKLPNGNVPIIAVTANTFTGEQENCLRHGITQVLNKPINKITLEMALFPHRHQGSPQDGDKQQRMPVHSISLPLSLTAVDEGILQTLMDDLGKDKVIRLLDTYRKDALILVSQIKNGTPLESNTYAHTLAGMSENLGIQLVGKAARKIMHASQQTPENLPFLIQDLEHDFEHSLTEIQDIVRLAEANSSP